VTTDELRIVRYDLLGFGNNFEITILLTIVKIPLMASCPIARLDFNEEHKHKTLMYWSSGTVNCVELAYMLIPTFRQGVCLLKRYL
jgi:hypothetical protein